MLYVDLNNKGHMMPPKKKKKKKKQVLKNNFSPVPEDLNFEELYLSEDKKLEFLHFTALFSNAQ